MQGISQNALLQLYSTTINIPCSNAIVNGLQQETVGLHYYVFLVFADVNGKPQHFALRCVKQSTYSAVGRRLIWVVGCLYVNLSCARSEAAINQTALDNKRDWPGIFGRFVFIWSWFWRMRWFAYTANATARLRRIDAGDYAAVSAAFEGKKILLSIVAASKFIVLSRVFTSLNVETSDVLTGHFMMARGQVQECKHRRETSSGAFRVLLMSSSLATARQTIERIMTSVEHFIYVESTAWRIVSSLKLIFQPHVSFLWGPLPISRLRKRQARNRLTSDLSTRIPSL